VHTLRVYELVRGNNGFGPQARLRDAESHVVRSNRGFERSDLANGSFAGTPEECLTLRYAHPALLSSISPLPKPRLHAIDG